MIHGSFDQFSGRLAARTARNHPVAIVFSEDGVLLDHTLDHLKATGFAAIALIDGTGSPGPVAERDDVDWIASRFRTREDVAAILNALAGPLAERWLFYCYNAEYLFFPYGEERSVADITTFLAEERRSSTHAAVVDLYTDDLERDPAGISIDNAHFDRCGYYATRRFAEGEPLERQSDIYGGLKWRFEEHVPWGQRRIDRICLYRADPKVTLNGELLFSDPEWNTISCPWHNNLTISVASFRSAKALMHNPGSRHTIRSLGGPQSERFAWNSRQLMELGFMEPGQWF